MYIFLSGSRGRTSRRFILVVSLNVYVLATCHVFFFLFFFFSLVFYIMFIPIYVVFDSCPLGGVGRQEF